MHDSLAPPRVHDLHSAARLTRCPALCVSSRRHCRFGAGNTFWSVNIDDLAKQYNVYAVDWRGCGASTRERFTAKEAMEAEDWFVQGLVRWREAHPHKAHTLDKFIIVAHSMGAMIAAKYERVAANVARRAGSQPPSPPSTRHALAATR